MAFNRLTRGHDNAGFKVLEQSGVVEEDWIRMASDPELARRVVEQFLDSRLKAKTRVPWTRKDKSLLKPFGRVIPIPTDSTPFDTATKFVVNTDPGAGLLISYISENARQAIGKVVELATTTETKLRLRVLQWAATGSEIITALGGAEISRREMYHYLQKADRSQWHLFALEGWVVDADWFDGGWDLDADVASDPGRCDGGNLLVARD